MRPLTQQRPWNVLGLYVRENKLVEGGREWRRCAAISHILENHDSWGDAKECSTLQCCAKSQSARYRLDIILGVVFKMVWIYICRHVESRWVETSRTESRQDAKCWGGGEKRN